MTQSDSERLAARDGYAEDNRAVWNLWLARDTESDHFKDVALYRATGSSLRPIERGALGDVSGHSLLHLQCNLGSETLSWARLGARATGVDISDRAIAYARNLADEDGLEQACRFVRANLYDLPATLDERFDIVIATYGALCWAPDVDAWMRVAAGCLAPGGKFLLVDLHPIGMAVTTEEVDPRGVRFRLAAPYFHSAEPQTGQPAGEPPAHAWTYGLGEVVTACVAAGMRVEELGEYPYAHWRQFPQLLESGDGYWRWPDASCTLPLLFSLQARG